MKKRTLIAFLLMVASLHQFREQGLSQSNQDVNFKSDRPSRYSLGPDEKLLFPVNILGLVHKPGQYMVEYNTDLISLIAFAGGFRDDAKITDVKIVRNAASNGKAKRKAAIYSVDIKKYFETGDVRQLPPQLMPDDTIIVSGSTTRTVTRVFDFVSRAALLAQIYFFIRVGSER